MKIYINKHCSDISLAKKFLIELNFGTDKNYCLEYSDNGKPNLVCDGKQAGFISISHSDGTLAMAFSDKPVGIDIERKDRKISVCQNIEEWTKIEAYCKYTGEGLSKKAVSMKLPEHLIKTFYSDEFVVSVCGEEEIDTIATLIDNRLAQ